MVCINPHLIFISFNLNMWTNMWYYEFEIYHRLTVYVNMHECIKDRLHQFIMQGCQKVVVQLDPLQTVQVLECWSWNVLDPKKKKKPFDTWYSEMIQEAKVIWSPCDILELASESHSTTYMNVENKVVLLWLFHLDSTHDFIQKKTLKAQFSYFLFGKLGSYHCLET